MTPTLAVYIETGNKLTFAVAQDWPGWARSAHSEAEAIERLIAYAPRYARAIHSSGVAFPYTAPVRAEVTARLQGDATTDFGVPEVIPEDDWRKLQPAELERSKAILNACWGHLDEVFRKVQDKVLTVGPRGGGRELAAIYAHTIQGDQLYLRRLGCTYERPEGVEGVAWARELRKLLLAGLEASNRGEIPEYGPRGGKRWPARYFVRRVAWHTLDHIWEIEDRVPHR